MRNIDTHLSNGDRRIEQKKSPVFSFADKIRSKVGSVLERGKEVLGAGLKEAFSWALTLGIFSGTVNLILGNPAYFVPMVLSYMKIGAVGGTGVGMAMNIIRGGKRR